MTNFSSIFRAVGARFTAWVERERAYAELSALDDHTLADLGLRRSDIPFAVFDYGRKSFESANDRSKAANGNRGRHAA